MLLIGYGNSGRGDDGLGPAFADRIESAGLPGLSVDIDYQLTVDHALAVAEADKVVFVDASMEAEGAYDFGEVRAGAGTLTSHSLTPATVLALAKTLYDREPEAYLLGIAGREFGEVKEGLSETARRNLDLAEAFFLQWYGQPDSAESRWPQPVRTMTGAA